MARPCVRLCYKDSSLYYLAEYQVDLEALGPQRQVNFPVSAAVATVLADCYAFQPFASKLQRQAK